MVKWILPLVLIISQAAFALEDLSSPDVELGVSEASTPVVVSPETHSIQAVKETDIPVHLEAAKKASTADSPWMRMFMGLIVVGILGAGSWVFIKRSKSANRTSSLAPEIKVLAQHHLGPKKTLAIIRVAGESILLGVTDSNISLIKSLSLLDEEIPETVPSNFDSVFAKKNEEVDFSDTAKIQKKTASKEEVDEFSISGIKDVVTNRLKNMRTFQ